jgi:hypothetical protein
MDCFSVNCTELALRAMTTSVLNNLNILIIILGVTYVVNCLILMYGVRSGTKILITDTHSQRIRRVHDPLEISTVLCFMCSDKC